MKYEQWNPVPRDPEGEAALRTAGISPLAALALAGRGIRTADRAEAFLADRADLLHDPFLLKDMDLAVARIRLALERGETIAVFGDYDVDGITSTCLLTAYLRERGAKVIPYIPDRLSEGYSLNREAVARLRRQGAELLVCVDCGITSFTEADFAAELGLDLIITDHHECWETLPRALAVINPHRSDCSYPFKELAGVGVALKLILALTPESNRSDVLRAYSDLAAVGTVADVMSLTGENRAIVSMGLRMLSSACRPGLRMLLRECGLEGKEITSTSVSYTLAPRLNAAGRMGCPMLAAELLLTRDARRGAELALNLCDLNRDRQLIEQKIFADCMAQLERRPDLAERAIVLAGHHWHQGVVGIVASRLSEIFRVPAFMICLDETGMGKGSCRSYGALNLFQSLSRCAPLLEGFGGHELAAGFTIRAENIAAFRAQIRDIAGRWAQEHPAVSALTVDAELDDVRLLTPENILDLRRLEPFGADNPQPVFVLRGAAVTAITPLSRGKHTRLRVSRDGCGFDAVLFSCSPESTRLHPGSRADLAFYPQLNHFRGSCTVQLLLADVRPAPSSAQLDRMLYLRWQRGESFARWELDLLLPRRRDFVAVWRYLSAHAAGNLFQESPARLARNIARAAGQRESLARTMICLEVFQERGLIRFSSGQNVIQISLKRVDGKVDLDASQIMIDLRNRLG